MFIGDLLISGAVETSDLLVPTVGSIEEVFPAGSGFAPKAFAQKIAVIGSNFAGGWSGNEIAARSFFGGLYEDYLRGALSLESIDANLKDLASSKVGRELSLAMVYRGPTGEVYFKDIGVEHHQVPPLQRVVCMGSGGEALAKLLSRSVRSPGTMVLDPGGGFFVHARVGRIASELFQLEVANRQSILNYYGGGYEAAMLTAEGFAKVDRALHVFFQATAGESGARIHLPHRIVYQCYVEDVLVIRFYSLSGGEDRAGQTIGTAQEYFRIVIPPIYRRLTDAERIEISRRSFAVEQQWLYSHLHLFGDKNRPTRFATTVTCDPATRNQVQIYPEENDEMELLVSSELIDSLARVANRFIQEGRGRG